MEFPSAGAAAQSYSRRGNERRVAGAVYRIEGESVTMTEIAKRLGVPVSTASKRLSKLKGATGAVTWKRLLA